MLTVEILNDGKGNAVIGHYWYTVKVNCEVIASGRVERFERREGWQALVRRVLEESERQGLLDVYEALSRGDFSEKQE